MKILQRYIVKELLVPFTLCLVVLNFIFMGGYLVRAANFIIGRGVPLTDTVYIILLALPEMVGYTVPTSILMAVLIAFGGLSQNNELRAMKASGVNLFHVVIPVLIIGIGLSFAMFAFSDQITTNAGFEMRKTMKKMMIKFPKALIEPSRFVKLNESIIFMTKEVRGDDLIDIVAYEMEDSNKPVRTIIAERGRIISDTNSGKVQIRLFDGSISDAQEEGIHTIQFKTYEFPSLNQEDVSKMQKKKRDYTLAEMLIRLGEKIEEKRERRDLWTAFHQRISFACGSFIFVFIGIPIAILVRRGEIVLSFGVAMALAAVYYILFVGAKTLSVEGLLPSFFAMWVPNLLLFGAGFYLFKNLLAR